LELKREVDEKDANSQKLFRNVNFIITVNDKDPDKDDFLGYIEIRIDDIINKPGKISN
jgi:hypothetical protein